MVFDEPIETMKVRFDQKLEDWLMVKSRSYYLDGNDKQFSLRFIHIKEVLKQHFLSYCDFESCLWIIYKSNTMISITKFGEIHVHCIHAEDAYLDQVFKMLHGYIKEIDTDIIFNSGKIIKSYV
ncbi:hypothetical protein A616_16805 [Brevibacillus brevis X23]|nr:hypothetical protein A616_16805 [Brevibacillus brevis X23]